MGIGVDVRPVSKIGDQSQEHLNAVLRCVAEIMSAREGSKKAALEGAPLSHVMGGAIGEADWIAELYDLTHEVHT